MWKTIFEGYREGETIGTIVAIYNKGLIDEFVFTGTVNLDDSKGKNEFIEKAKLALIEKVKPVDISITNTLKEIDINLNK